MSANALPFSPQKRILFIQIKTRGCWKYLIATRYASHNYCSNGIEPAFNYCIGPIMENRQNMTMDQLVDILAQKTGKFTQLLVYKDFGNEYRECKEAIQQILAEIELRKEKTIVQQNKATLA